MIESIIDTLFFFAIPFSEKIIVFLGPRYRNFSDDCVSDTLRILILAPFRMLHPIIVNIGN